MLELKNISYLDASTTHIYPTDLSLQPGEFNNLLGATLSGKTTLIRLMAGLEQPSAGCVLFDGEDVTAQSVRDRDVSMVYQQFVNYPTMNVFDNIASPLCARGRPPSDWKHRVGEVAEMIRISDLLDRMPHELSGGQQQRIAIARSLVRPTRLVLLDEPLANLDYKLREELCEELPRLFADRGSVIVYATTDPREALLMGGNTVLLYQGRVIQFGCTTDVYHHPKTLLAVRSFSNPPLNEMTMVMRDGKVVSETAGMAMPLHRKFAALSRGPCEVVFRPHHLKLGPPPRGSEWMPLRGEVILTEISGSESFVHVRVGSCEWILHTHKIISHAQNEKIEMHISIDNVMVFAKVGNSAETT